MVASLTTIEDDFGFHLPKQSKKVKQSARLYIGNLPADVDHLESALQKMFQEIANINVLEADITIVRPKQKQAQTCHAFVTCASNQDADRAIANLNRHQFQNQRLVVQRERKSTKGRNNSKNNINNNKGFNTKSKAEKATSGSAFSANSWSKPSNVSQKSASNNPKPKPILKQKVDNSATDSLTETSAAAATTSTDFLAEVVADEMKTSIDTGDKNEVLNTAIASMAAASFLSSALGDPDDNDDGAVEESKNIHEESTRVLDEIATIDDFRARCQKPLAELLDDYGEQDPNWQQVVPNDGVSVAKPPQNQRDSLELEQSYDVATISDFRARCQKPLSELLNDYGEEDPDWQQVVPTEMPKPKKEAKTVSFGIKQESEESEKTEQQQTESRLGRHGKAPIHVELVSFGYTHGAPPEIKRGWSHAHPLPAFECRDLPEVPGYLTWRDGVSGYVQRTLLTEPEVREMAQKLAEQSFEAIQEAINEGGHGYASPLQMKVYVGSDSGRHRAVVVAEHGAKIVRSRLRENKNNRISVPVSIGTMHRDVARVQQKRKDDRKGPKKDEFED